MTDYYFILNTQEYSLVTAESENIAIEAFNSGSINQPYKYITNQPNPKSKLIEIIKQRITESKK